METKSRMKNKPTKLSLKLAERIKRELGIEVEPRIRREHPSSAGRACGAWLWSMRGKDGFVEVGSQDTATKVSKARKWEHVRMEYVGYEIIIWD